MITNLKLAPILIMNSRVDEYLNNSNTWQEEMKLLRRIVLECQLIEEFKWKTPCYTFNHKNIVLINRFKTYCELGFFKGVLLNDEHSLLTQHGKNSQSSRGIKFINISAILKLELEIKAYIFEAIEVEKNGLKVVLKETSEFAVPIEFKEKLKADPILNTAFNALTPGRQRAYLLYFDAPKQAKTILARIDKCIPRILNGKGIHDCTCGLSKRMPSCDGSHKNFQSTCQEK